ncbi:hypothetical protein CEXT_747201 [Caerostris extrusa]|uniref:Uncharacterized protein n=1 Tax=Caerostris extrusa TaxID=172846 RepID=A0AAV4UNT9_CAEEX|nr:hypothetical protein CEXT_747201 [Caerostris extrusa]
MIYSVPWHKKSNESFEPWLKMGFLWKDCFICIANGMEESTGNFKKIAQSSAMIVMRECDDGNGAMVRRKNVDKFMHKDMGEPCISQNGFYGKCVFRSK